MNKFQWGALILGVVCLIAWIGYSRLSIKFNDPAIITGDNAVISPI